MQKVILLVGLVGTLAIPMWAARGSNTRKALKRLLLYTLGFDVVYVVVLRWLYPRF